MSKVNLSVNFGGFGILQIMLLILHYGKILILPLWLVWLPSLILGGILGIVLIILFIILISILISALFD